MCDERGGDLPGIRSSTQSTRVLGITRDTMISLYSIHDSKSLQRSHESFHIDTGEQSHVLRMPPGLKHMTHAQFCIIVHHNTGLVVARMDQRSVFKLGTGSTFCFQKPGSEYHGPIDPMTLKAHNGDQHKSLSVS